MACIAAAATKSAATGAKTRSWADVARRMAASMSEETPEKVAPCAETVPEDAKAEVASQTTSETSTEAALSERPWSHVAGRVASVFAECNEDPLRPGPRGSFLCECSGEVLIMFGHYGWIGTLDCIDHPHANKNGGRIYVHRNDVSSGGTLVEGDKVNFYLYVDEKGLGAEKVRLQGYTGVIHVGASLRALQEEEATKKKSNMEHFDPDAKEFVPILSRPTAVSTPLPCFYKPSPTLSTRSPQSTRFTVNGAYWSSSSDSEDVSSDESDFDYEGDDDKEVSRNKKANKFAFLALTSSADLRFPPGLPQRRTKLRAPDDCSASSSDDEDGHTLTPPPGLAMPPPGLLHPSLRSPPGLSLP